MATIIDSLIMTLGLDASGFEKGQKDVVTAIEKTKKTVTKTAEDIEDAQTEAVKEGAKERTKVVKESSRAQEKAVKDTAKETTQVEKMVAEARKKSQKEIEEAANKTTGALNKATMGVFDLLAAFIGTKNLKEFVDDSNRTNTALGNLGKTLNVAPDMLAAWGLAAGRMGGSAETAKSSIQGLSDMLQDFHTQGKDFPTELWRLQGESGKKIDLDHGVNEFALSLANAASELAKTDPAKANKFLRALVDPTLANLMIAQGPALRAYLGMLRHFAPTEADIKAAERSTNATNALNDAYARLATKISTALAPALNWLSEQWAKVVDKIASWVEDHPTYTTVLSSFFAVLTGVKIFQATKNVLALKDALLALGTANAVAGGGGLLGLLARISPVIAGLLVAGAVMAPGGLNEGEDERARQREHGQVRGSGNDAIRRRGTGGRVDTGGSSAGNLTKLIDEEARKAGVDPRIMEGIRAGESGHRQTYDKKDDAIESSWGPFQLNRRNGLGVQFERDTGLDLRDPKTIPAQARWVANYLKHGGSTRAWMGYRGPRDADPRWGDSGYVPDPNVTKTPSTIAEISRLANPPGSHQGGPVPIPKNMDPLWTGLPNHPSGVVGMRAAALGNINNSTHATTTSSSNELHVNGGIHVNAPNAVDSRGIANSIDSALAASLFANAANYGPN